MMNNTRVVQWEVSRGCFLPMLLFEDDTDSTRSLFEGDIYYVISRGEPKAIVWDGKMPVLQMAWDKKEDAQQYINELNQFT